MEAAQTLLEVGHTWSHLVTHLVTFLQAITLLLVDVFRMLARERGELHPHGHPGSQRQRGLLAFGPGLLVRRRSHGGAGKSKALANYYCLPWLIKVIPVLATATLLQLEGLISQSASLMRENVNLQTAVAFYEASQMYANLDVEEACLRWLQVISPGQLTSNFGFRN